MLLLLLIIELADTGIYNYVYCIPSVEIRIHTVLDISGTFYKYFRCFQSSLFSRK